MTSIIWDNIGTSSVSQRVQLEKYLKFSIDYINSLLINPINFDVVASLYELDNEGTIAQASSDFLPLDGRGETYAQPGMIEAISGREVAGAIDAFVTFNATNLSDLFFDQTPWSGNDVPSLSIDAIAVTVHELLHTIGFMTFSDDLTGENPGYTVPMDRLIFAAPDGKIYFTGEEAIAEFGGPVPLAYGSLAHMGAPFDLGRDIMYPAVTFGYRSYVSDLNLAMLRDMGVATIRGNDFVNTAGSDNFVGNNASDTFDMRGVDAAGTGNVLDGELGYDVAFYDGARSAYAISFAGDVAQISSGGRIDTLTSVERVEFADGTLLFDFDSSNADAAYRLYGGAFSRTPDEDGLRYWTFAWLNNDQTLHDAAAMFIGSDEFEDTYGAWITDLDFVSQLYRNVLGREGEGAGIDYWTDALAAATMDRADVLVQFTQLEEYVGLSNADLQNGYWVMA